MINNIYYGSDKPNAYYYGSDAADRIYYGSDLVYQKQDEYIFDIDVSRFTFPAVAVDMVVPLIDSYKNGKEQLYDLATTSTWIDVQMMYVDNDDGTQSCYAEVLPSINTSSQMRTGFVAFMQRESGLTLSIEVIQKGKVVSTTFHPETLNFVQTGGTKYCTYTPTNAVVTFDALGNYPWCTITISGGTVTVKAVANIKTSARSASYTFYVNGEQYSLSVTQDEYIMSRTTEKKQNSEEIKEGK